MTVLKPFWCYYGGKWRAAKHYPQPQHRTIIEPFAGAAGYALRYPDRDVVLVEKYPLLAEMWRYLTSVTSAEVLRIPTVESVDDLPAWVPAGGRTLVGFHMNHGTVMPCRTLSSGLRKKARAGEPHAGWSEGMRSRVARQVSAIKHWRIVEGDFRDAPNVEATWFVDPPYSNKAGSYYVHNYVDYAALAQWCRARTGQVIVCENEGATWLPFKPFRTIKAGVKTQYSREAIFYQESWFE